MAFGKVIRCEELVGGARKCASLSGHLRRCFVYPPLGWAAEVWLRICVPYLYTYGHGCDGHWSETWPIAPSYSTDAPLEDDFATWYMETPSQWLPGSTRLGYWCGTNPTAFEPSVTDEEAAAYYMNGADLGQYHPCESMYPFSRVMPFINGYGDLRMLLCASHDPEHNITVCEGSVAVFRYVRHELDRVAEVLHAGCCSGINDGPIALMESQMLHMPYNDVEYVPAVTAPGRIVSRGSVVMRMTIPGRYETVEEITEAWPTVRPAVTAEVEYEVPQFTLTGYIFGIHSAMYWGRLACVPAKLMFGGNGTYSLRYMSMPQFGAFIGAGPLDVAYESSHIPLPSNPLVACAATYRPGQQHGHVLTLPSIPAILEGVHFYVTR